MAISCLPTTPVLFVIILVASQRCPTRRHPVLLAVGAQPKGWLITTGIAADSGADEGHLSHLSQSIGLPAPPLTPAARAAEQTKKQKAIAQARGNANQPGPLPPAKRHKASDSEPLLERPFDDLTTEDDRVEWLLQAIDSFGYPKYCKNPQLHDSAALYEVYDALLHGEYPESDEETEDVAMLAPAPTPDPPVRTGLTRVLEHQKSGHRPVAKLVRTDNQTVLDGVPINAYHQTEFGQPISGTKLTRTDIDGAKLTRTDHTTLGLGRVPPLPPQTKGVRPGPTGYPSAKSHSQDLRHPAASGATTSRPMPPPMQPHSGNKPAPPPKRAFISRARVEAIRQENHIRNHGAKEGTTGTSAPANKPLALSGTASNPSSRKPQVPPPVNIEMADEILS
ncbi:hypothetical protein FRC06_003040, partial [Ceratobasidium sp. 370]